MNEFHHHGHWAFTGGMVLLILLGSSIAQPQTQSTVQPTQPTPAPQRQESKPRSRMDRPLKLLVTVDDQSFLQVKEGDQVKAGDVITDNRRERDRLTKEKKSIQLHIENLKNRAIHEPFQPKQPIPSKPLPSAIFSEEKAAISQAKLRLVHAKLVLDSRKEVLKTENPEKKSEVEKASLVLQRAQQKRKDQEELIQSMKDMKLQKEILQHEEAVLKHLTNDEKQAKSEVDTALAKLDATKVEQNQQLKQLEIAVQIAQSELEMAKSKLTAAQSRRRILEYQASIDETKQSQQQNQSQLEYSRQQQQYEQAIRERDYQIAQLSISLSTIEDKLSQIPLVLSPRTGYIRKIKPWVGNNGKYSTTITISLTPDVAKSSNGSSQSEKANTAADTGAED